MQTAIPFLMFSGKNYGKAEEAIKLYTSIFENAVIKKIEHYQEGEAEGKAGTVKTAYFTIAGSDYMAHDSQVDHAFNFTPSISIFVTFQIADEVDAAYKELVKDGAELMPMDDYGIGRKFGWVADRYGVSWQLKLE